MTDQEQAPFDLAEGRDLRIVEAFYTGVARTGDEHLKAAAADVLALVTALKAATQKNTELSGIIVEAAQASPDGLVFAVLEQALKREIEQLRADLDQAQMERDDYSRDLARVEEQIHREDTELESRYEAALARIAELEGSLRGVYETHGRVDDGPCWCGDCERARSNLPAQTPSAS